MWLIAGYAGPGKYTADGTGGQINGSPIVALELARKHRRFTPPRDVRCVFIEAMKAHPHELTQNVQPSRMTVCTWRFQGSVAERLAAGWAHVGDKPVLTSIDPFGVSAVSKEQMTDTLLARNREAPCVRPILNHHRLADTIQRRAVTDPILTKLGRMSIRAGLGAKFH